MKTRFPGRRPSICGGILAVVALCAGCASTPVPDAQLAVSRNAISDALGAGAAEAAPLEIRNAREKMARADAAVAADRQDEARLLAEEAEVDARLAAAKARTARANLAVAEIREGIRTLRETVNHPDAPPSATGRPQ